MARLIELLFVQLVFEFGIFLPQQLMEFGLVFYVCEFERFAGGEDDGLFGEVTV